MKCLWSLRPFSAQPTRSSRSIPLLPRRRWAGLGNGAHNATSSGKSSDNEKVGADERFLDASRMYMHACLMRRLQWTRSRNADSSPAARSPSDAVLVVAVRKKDRRSTFPSTPTRFFQAAWTFRERAYRRPWRGRCCNYDFMSHRLSTESGHARHDGLQGTRARRREVIGPVNFCRGQP